MSFANATLQMKDIPKDFDQDDFEITLQTLDHSES